MNDAFDEGIGPGGLRSRSDIMLLVCYMLAAVNQPLSKDDIIRVMQENGIANYFEAASAVAAIIDKGNADVLPDDKCIANDNTVKISNELQNMLPHTIRVRAENGALQLLAMARRETENQVEIEKTEDGYQVTCHISDGQCDMLSFTIKVPDYQQARVVRKNFQKDPQKVYQVMLGLLIDNKSYLSSLLLNE